MFLSLFGATVDGVVALEQASTPGRVLASAAFADLLPSPSDFAFTSRDALEGVGPVFWLDPAVNVNEASRRSLTDFMKSRPPRRQASSIVVAGLFSSTELTSVVVGYDSGPLS